MSHVTKELSDGREFVLNGYRLTKISPGDGVKVKSFVFFTIVQR